MSGPSINPAPRTPGQLALELHRARNSNLEIEVSASEITNLTALPADEAYKIEGNKLVFASLDERNRLTATEIFAGFTDDGATGYLVTADSLMQDELLHPVHAAARLVVLCGVNRDVLLDAAAVIQSSGGKRPYGLATMIGEALAELPAISANSLSAFCAALQQSYDGSMIASPFFERLVPVLIARSDLRAEVLEICALAPNSTSSDLHRAVLFALGCVDTPSVLHRVSTGVRGNYPVTREVCMWMVGRLCARRDLTGEQVREIDGLLEPYLADADNELHSVACQNVVYGLPDYQFCHETWRRLIAARDMAAVKALASGLFTISRSLEPLETILPLVNDCLSLGTEEDHELGRVDHVLCLLLGKSAVEQVIGWFTRWIREHGSGVFCDSDFVKLFPQTVHWLMGEPDTFGKLITSCLLDDERNPAAAAGGLLSHAVAHDKPGVSLDMSAVDLLDAQGLFFLCRRILGFVLQERQLLSLTLSFLRTSNAKERTFELVRDALVNEIGYDYPEPTLGTLATYRQSCADQGEAALLDEIVRVIGENEASLSALPVANELMPPARLSRSFAVARAKAMDRAMRDARNESVWAQLVHRVPVKGGTGFFRMVDGAYPAVTKMTTQSVTTALPRRDVLDPVGQVHRRLIFQTTRRGSK
ncbi:hypothetical protein [Paraburkholderia pallida]|uniref:Uncharacterized protein n=1 Tax=Paraburkholderia pallida TaxID=2547399 RepID=A0A4P7D4Z3_9BURK|nr:hypothetical protein [Paraburkholderia pallida]QBR03769.1 hypothetical protein E1956_42540 [Paraburkholderia pallida]